MGFRGGGGRGGGGRGNFGGRGGGGRGGGRGGGGRNFDAGPPDHVVEVGHFLHKCENDLVCSTTCGKIPFFNAPVYFENKEQVGKIDEIFGSPEENGFSVKLSEGVKASSFKDEQKLYIDPSKLLPVDRFLSGAKPPGGGRGRGGSRGGQRGGQRGGNQRGGFGNRGSFQGNRGGGGGFNRDGGGGGFRGNRGGSRGGGDFRGGRGGGAGFKRPSTGFGGAGAQNKKIKFDS